MQEAGYRGFMLSPDDSAMPYMMCADVDKALEAVLNPFMASVKNMVANGGGIGGGYVPNSTPSGQTSGQDATSPADAKKKLKKKQMQRKKLKKLKKLMKKRKMKQSPQLKRNAKKKLQRFSKKYLKQRMVHVQMRTKLKAAVAKIDKENVLEVLETWEKSPYAEKMDKSLIETIHNDTDGFLWMGATDDEYLKPIAEALRARSNSKDAICVQV